MLVLGCTGLTGYECVDSLKPVVEIPTLLWMASSGAASTVVCTLYLFTNYKN
jgi:hypothetical protein